MQTKLYHEPRDIGSFLDGIALEVKRNGFCATGLSLVVSYLESNGMDKTISAVQELAAFRNMSAVRTEEKIVFRKTMKPMLDGTYVQRASGDVVCDICSFQFKYHPSDLSPNEFLTVLCNGRRGKL